jgi:phosphoribosylamine---glycine ligase
MKILIVGNGGREHALLRKLRADAPGAEFFITRGNGGTRRRWRRRCRSIPTDVPALADVGAHNGIDLAVCGPEAPLAAGIADVFCATACRSSGRPRRRRTSRRRRRTPRRS